MASSFVRNIENSESSPEPRKRKFSECVRWGEEPNTEEEKDRMERETAIGMLNWDHRYHNHSGSGELFKNVG